MSTRTPKRYTSFGALDSDAIASGRASDAQTLRTLAMSANRLSTRGQPLAQMVWSSPNETSRTAGALMGFAPPFYLQITPTIPIVKKPLIDSAKLFFGVGVSTAGAVTMQVATLGAPFDPNARGAANTFAIGPGGSDPYELQLGTATSLRLLPGVTEEVTYYVRARPGDLGDTGDNGSPNTGKIVSVTDDGRTINCSTSGGGSVSWNDANDANNWGSTGHCLVVVRQSTSIPAIEPRWIRTITTDNQALYVYPPIPSDATGDALRGAEFEIRKIPLFRVGYLSLYAEEVAL